MTQHIGTPNFLLTYPVNMLDMMLIVPYELPDPLSALTHSVFIAVIVDILIVFNGFVRKCIALILNRQYARSVVYYVLDTFRIVHGGPSEMPLRNISEYGFRFMLSVLSTFYSTTICMLYMQYMYLVKTPIYATLADVQRADLPLICLETGQFGQATSLPYQPVCMRSFAAPQNGLQADGTLVRHLLRANVDANQTAYLTSDGRIDWLRDILGNGGGVYRVLMRPVTRQYQTFAVSMFNGNVALYEHLLQRAAEHGFLEYLMERDLRVNYAQYLFEAHEFEQDREEQTILYAPMRIEDFRSSILTFYFMWITAAIVCVLERLTYGWSVGDVLNMGRRWIAPRLMRWSNIGYAK